MMQTAPSAHNKNLNKPNRYIENDLSTPNTYMYILTLAMNAHTKSIKFGHGIGKSAAKTMFDVDNGIVTHE